MRRFITTVLELIDCIEILTRAARNVAKATITIVDEIETVSATLQEESDK